MKLIKNTTLFIKTISQEQLDGYLAITLLTLTIIYRKLKKISWMTLSWYFVI